MPLLARRGLQKAIDGLDRYRVLRDACHLLHPWRRADVERQHVVGHRRPIIADDPLGRIALRRSLEQLLLSLGMGARSFLAFEVGRTPVLEVQLTTQPEEALIS